MTSRQALENPKMQLRSAEAQKRRAHESWGFCAPAPLRSCAAGERRAFVDSRALSLC
jgi:hypothetical protein